MVRRLLVIVAALVVGSLGCAHSAKPLVTDVAGNAGSPAPFSPDQDVPLLAPDAEPAATVARLTAPKTIGGGPDDTSVDGRRRGGNATPRASSPTTRTTVPRTRGYYRPGYGTGYTNGYSAIPTSTGASTTNGGITPVGGNYPSVPSYGGAVAH